LFDAAGLDPQTPPLTWADLIAYGKKLTKFDNGRMMQSGFGLKTKGTHSMLDYFAILNQMGGTVLDENGAPALNTSVARDALSFYVSLVKEHRLNDPDFLPGEEGFPQGKTAMHTAGSWFGDQMDMQYPDLNYGVALMPRMEGAQPLTCDIGSWGWSVSARSKNKDAAMRLFTFLNTRDSHVALFGVEGMPARADVVADARIEQLVVQKPDLGVFMQGAEHSVFIGDTVDWPRFEAAITARLESIFYDNVGIDQALAGMQKDAEKIMGR
jgi:ABC-type glycerol-3-phosphate transport system substrate-binding protein